MAEVLIQLSISNILSLAIYTNKSTLRVTPILHSVDIFNSAMILPALCSLGSSLDMPLYALLSAHAIL